jgi:hypothetical protein
VGDWQRSRKGEWACSTRIVGAVKMVAEATSRSRRSFVSNGIYGEGRSAHGETANQRGEEKKEGVQEGERVTRKPMVVSKGTGELGWRRNLKKKSPALEKGNSEVEVDWGVPGAIPRTRALLATGRAVGALGMARGGRNRRGDGDDGAVVLGGFPSVVLWRGEGER